MFLTMMTDRVHHVALRTVVRTKNGGGTHAHDRRGAGAAENGARIHVAHDGGGSGTEDGRRSRMTDRRDHRRRLRRTPERVHSPSPRRTRRGLNYDLLQLSLGLLPTDERILISDRLCETCNQTLCKKKLSKIYI